MYTAPKHLTHVRAAAGNPREYRSVSAPGGVVPRVDAVELRATPGWLKSDRAVTAELTPREARTLAIKLLEAADKIEDRLSEGETS